MKKTILLSFALCIMQFHVCCQIQIPGSFYGINFWLTDYSATPVGAPTNTFTSTEWTRTTESGAKVMRVGGREYNNHPKFLSILKEEGLLLIAAT